MCSDRVGFLRWARDSLIPLSTVTPGSVRKDLAPLGEMIADATVVALGEGDHFGAQPMLFRNRLLEYLVEEKGFTAVAIESGIVESRVVHDYVRGGSGELGSVMAQGIGWTFDRAPQNEALVRWLREYNAKPHIRRKVNFYGFDVPGSPGNPNANRGMETALLEALQYLERVDPRAARAFHARVDSLLPGMRFDRYRPDDPGYHRFSRAERDALTGSIVDLQALLEAREAPYTANSTPDDYEWALRASIGARQVDSWLRQIPLRWQASDEQFRFLDLAGDLRDRAQADNLDWIVRWEGPSGKILVFGHNGHLSASPVKWNWRPLDQAARAQEISGTYLHEVAGTYLRRRFRDALYVIGNLIGNGAVGVGGVERTLEPASADSLDGLARKLGVPFFLLDLRTAPAEVAEWLMQPIPVGPGFELSQRYKISFELSAGRAFDVLFYVDAITPAG